MFVIDLTFIYLQYNNPQTQCH